MELEKERGSKGVVTCRKEGRMSAGKECGRKEVQCNAGYREECRDRLRKEGRGRREGRRVKARVQK